MALLLLILAIIGCGDEWSVTVYPAIEEEDGTLIPLGRETYVISKNMQTVSRQQEDDEPVRLVKASVVNAKNWSASCADGSATFAMVDGEFVESPAPLDDGDPVIFVSQWQWLRAR
jgi:hypothetical protein